MTIATLTGLKGLYLGVVENFDVGSYAFVEWWAVFACHIKPPIGADYASFTIAERWRAA